MHFGFELYSHYSYLQTFAAHAMKQTGSLSMQLRLQWLFLADNYRNLGEKERAYEVVKDLVAFSSETNDLSELEERYRQHVMEWEEFSATIAQNERYKEEKK